MYHDKVYGLHYVKHGVKASQCFNQWSEKVNYLRDTSYVHGKEMGVLAFRVPLP